MPTASAGGRRRCQRSGAASPGAPARPAGRSQRPRCTPRRRSRSQRRRVATATPAMSAAALASGERGDDGDARAGSAGSAAASQLGERRSAHRRGASTRLEQVAQQLVDAPAFELRVGREQHPVAQGRQRAALDVVGRDEVAPVEQRGGARRAHQRDRAARAARRREAEPAARRAARCARRSRPRARRRARATRSVLQRRAARARRRTRRIDVERQLLAALLVRSCATTIAASSSSDG